MARKAAKSLAISNTSKLNITHAITALIHILLLILLFSPLHLNRSLAAYFIFSLPALLIETYLEVIGRPKFNATDGSLKNPGVDLDAKGLMEYMWDVVYWSWINIILVLGLGDRAWWLYAVVPGYAVYLVTTTIGGLRGMMSGGLGGAGGEGQEQGPGVSGGSGSGSNRQKKLEKRGGQRVAYR